VKHHFVPHSHKANRIPNPFLAGGFEGVYDSAGEAAKGLLKAIREEHSF
jgi:hypothetical protein